jgi:hypothetical protein
VVDRIPAPAAEREEPAEPDSEAVFGDAGPRRRFGWFRSA